MFSLFIDIVLYCICTPLTIEATTYTYDHNGNRITKHKVRVGHENKPQDTSYAYDPENRLTTINYSHVPHIKGNDSFSYSGDGLRTQMVTNANAFSFLYDGSNVLVERDASGAVTRSYTRGLDLGGGINSLIAQSIPGSHKDKALRYYQYNDLGSVSELTNPQGKASSSYQYDAFGNLLNTPDRDEREDEAQGKEDNDDNRYLFSSKELDNRSNLYYFGARYYDPEIGRWLTPDPLGMVDGPNVYAYVNNNPVNMVDPYGLTAGELLGNGDFLGTQSGADALDYYAMQWAKTGNPLWAVPGFFAALWTPETYGKTLTVLSLADAAALYEGRAFYQYLPKGASNYTSPYITRGAGFGPPYNAGEEAVTALKLPSHNPGTAVQRVNVNPFEPILGPRSIKGGIGKEYYRGWTWPTN